MNPQYPVYIISKGRWESRLTSKSLERLEVPYRIVIEPQEYVQYSAAIDPSKILTLPFSNLGQGSIPARNWVWDHAIKEGYERHWILDDNIREFYRLNHSNRNYIADGTGFRVIEDFANRFENVALAGMNYHMFGFCSPAKAIKNPFIMNTRIYSCILILNSIPFRWRGRYNEDTDLSLRALKAGWCTLLFYAFLCGKNATMKMKGGNTDQLYKQDEQFDGRLEMARSLVRQHPDCVRIARRWGRWQHVVNYKPFTHNRLIPRKGIEIENGINNYGLELVKKERS